MFEILEKERIGPGVNRALISVPEIARAHKPPQRRNHSDRELDNLRESKVWRRGENGQHLNLKIFRERQIVHSQPFDSALACNGCTNSKQRVWHSRAAATEDGPHFS